MLKRATIKTSTSNSNNIDYDGVNETHEYHYKEEVFDIDDEREAEEIRSIIDRKNWEIVYEMMKNSNTTVGYHGGQLQVLSQLSQIYKYKMQASD